ncbi:OLC1v1001482C1 [Oldenlandia corymbosa var. corymbosa]|uniref:OLC1v1001482C1 n=1 Tax=Oldenlandia corymbosa var. corymbosa TaxID=529605 RepID=A0AAV1D5B3_OLDCO|nr:OLC1v1001482C1 [Oldenlandia corymbosa var. corymbosa]
MKPEELSSNESGKQQLTQIGDGNRSTMMKETQLKAGTIVEMEKIGELKGTPRGSHKAISSGSKPVRSSSPLDLNSRVGKRNESSSCDEVEGNTVKGKGDSEKGADVGWASFDLEEQKTGDNTGKGKIQEDDALAPEKNDNLKGVHKLNPQKEKKEKKMESKQGISVRENSYKKKAQEELL